MIEEFFTANWPWVITISFAAGGFYYFVQNMMSRLDKHVNKMESRFSELSVRETAQQMRISELEVRMARQEERSEALQEIKAQVSDIWKHLMRQKNSN